MFSERGNSGLVLKVIPCCRIHVGKWLLVELGVESW